MHSGLPRHLTREYYTHTHTPRSKVLTNGCHWWLSFHQQLVFYLFVCCFFLPHEWHLCLMNIMCLRRLLNRLCVCARGAVVYTYSGAADWMNHQDGAGLNTSAHLSRSAEVQLLTRAATLLFTFCFDQIKFSISAKLLRHRHTHTHTLCCLRFFLPPRVRWVIIPDTRLSHSEMKTTVEIKQVLLLISRFGFVESRQRTPKWPTEEIDSPPLVPFKMADPR